MAPRKGSVIRPYAFELETLAYRDRIMSDTTGLGGSIGYHALNVMDIFAKGLKANNLYDLLWEYSFFVGNNFFPTALHKPKYAQSMKNAYANFTSGDFSESTGLNPGAGNTNRYLDTGLVANSSNAPAQSNLHLAWYGLNSVGTTLAGGTGPTEISASNSSSSGICQLYTRFNLSGTLSIMFDAYDGSLGRISAANSDNSGLTLASRTSQSAAAIYSRPDGKYLLFVKSTNSPSANTPQSGRYSESICGFYSIGAGLTAGQNAILYTLVNTAQRQLGRIS